MSFDNILSSNVVETPRPLHKQAAPVKPTRRTSPTPNGARPATTFDNDDPPISTVSKSACKMPSTVKEDVGPRVHAKEPVKPKTSKVAAAKLRAVVSDKENEDVTRALAEINEMEHSDAEAAGGEKAKETQTRRSRKRLLAVEEGESAQRKVGLLHPIPKRMVVSILMTCLQRRRTAYTAKFAKQFEAIVKGGKEQFRQSHEDAALTEVQRQEVLDEKERKKDMQRKRRREKTIQNETLKQREAMERAKLATDNAEREKLLKEAQRAEKKAKNTKRALDTGDVTDSLQEVAPLAPNLEGGTMSTFQAGKQASPEPPKKKQARGQTIRPKKSKEKKQAEIHMAEAAYAAMERDDQRDPVPIAPKEDSRRETLMRETKEAKEAKQSKEASPAGAPTTNYASKGYQQIYDQIWKDMARKDVPKVYRIKENSMTTKQSNLRKTAQLAAKEARRWQLRTNKGTKDVQARAKRSMREMMSFWKRNEREERDLRRVAEKQELDNAKKAEAEREANRQKRKLNFLIAQTELYSHFIKRKVRTEEVERSTDGADVVGSGETTVPSDEAAIPAIDVADGAGPIAEKVAISDLDFDEEDDTRRNEAATANVQNAFQTAQAKARGFNTEGQLQAQLDEGEGEMNFQNPTMGEDLVHVNQPTMLTTQLKEYQLKGLNWLVNLYEKGINGILADEMGLGKTVQSISVMAYLAETHNIWGPFLVIAPSSTLHNWQQEITRFVPNLKILPYWGTAKDRKVLRKHWDRKHITYTQEAPFHVLITSYQLVVQDTQYFQKIRWQYMILDEAQAIKSSQSSRWKNLLGFHCRNRLLLTGTPIQNNMQELWALLHFIMPTLFDSHDEFSLWFSKDIESHAQSNTRLNEEQLLRLHKILKPFMLRRMKKHVQKELGDKIELDIFCDLTYRQRAYYGNLRNKISIMDLIEKAAVGDDQDTATLMNLVMQFRKVCNHPDLFERADITSPLSLAHFAETASFLREGNNVNVGYSTRNLIEYDLPRLLCSPEARLDMAGPGNDRAGFWSKHLQELMNIWTPASAQQSSQENGAFSWLRFADTSTGEAYRASHTDIFMRAARLRDQSLRLGRIHALYDDEDAKFTPHHALFNVVDLMARRPLADMTEEGHMARLLNVSQDRFYDMGLNLIEQCARPGASAPPIQIACSSQASCIESRSLLFNLPMRKTLYGLSERDELALLEAKVDPGSIPPHNLLPAPLSDKARYTNIHVPSMRRFVTDSGKLAKLDGLLRELRQDGHRVLLYFQMTRMIDLMEEYLTYRNYKYLRLDGSTKLEDRRDTVHDFQTRPEIFIFLLSTRAGGLGINLTSADTVIFYDSDWNPTIDSQAMDRAHRLGQTKQVTVYRMITRGTIEERIRKRALQKEEVQRVVISGGGGAGVDFNTRSKETRKNDVILWLADDEETKMFEEKEKEKADKDKDRDRDKGDDGGLVGGKKGGKKKGGGGAGQGGRKKDLSLDDMYHEG